MQDKVNKAFVDLHPVITALSCTFVACSQCVCECVCVLVTENMTPGLRVNRDAPGLQHMLINQFSTASSATMTATKTRLVSTEVDAAASWKLSLYHAIHRQHINGRCVCVIYNMFSPSAASSSPHDNYYYEVFFISRMQSVVHSHIV